MEEPLFSIGNFGKADSAKGDVVSAMMIYNSIKGNRGSSIVEGPFFDINRWRFEDMEISATQIELELKQHCLERLKLQLESVIVIPTKNRTLLLSIVISTYGGKANEPINFVIRQNRDTVLVDYMS